MRSRADSHIHRLLDVFIADIDGYGVLEYDSRVLHQSNVGLNHGCDVR